MHCNTTPCLFLGPSPYPVRIMRFARRGASNNRAVFSCKFVVCWIGLLWLGLCLVVVTHAAEAVVTVTATVDEQHTTHSSTTNTAGQSAAVIPPIRTKGRSAAAAAASSDSSSDAVAGDDADYVYGPSLDGTVRRLRGEMYQNPWGELCVDGQCYEASFSDEVLRIQGRQMKRHWDALEAQHCRDLRNEPPQYCQDRRYLCTPDHPDMLTYCAKTCRSCFQEYEPAELGDPHRLHRAKYYVPPSKAVTYVKYARVYDAAGSDLGVPQIVQPIPGRRLTALERRIQQARVYLQDEVQTDDLYFPVRGNKCRNQHELCTLWAVLGRCHHHQSGHRPPSGRSTAAQWNLTQLTPGGGDDTTPTVPMNTSCAPVCFSCHQLHPNSRCPIDYNQPHAWYPGDLNAMFERILLVADAADNEAFNVTVVSRPQPIVGPKKRDDDDGYDDDDDDDGPPWLLVIDNFLTKDRAQALELVAIATTQDGSSVGTPAPASSTDEWAFRCESSHCEASHEPVQELLHRLAQLTGISRPNLDYVHFIRTARAVDATLVEDRGVAPIVPPSNRHDYNASDKWSARGVPVLTAWLFLNDLPPGSVGGEIEFPFLRLTNEHNATQVVAPRVGRLVLWPNVRNDDPHEADGATKYRVRPVVNRRDGAEGEFSNDPFLWTAQVRIHQRHVRTARENGC